jgi:quinol monooxygenase YgiN
MITVFAKHTVEDYDTWKAAWDEMASTHEKYGVMGDYRLFREAGKPNEVVIMNEWESKEGIQRFMKEVDLEKAMGDSSVIGEPELYFLEEIESKIPERPPA